jgi:HNH endonuclease
MAERTYSLADLSWRYAAKVRIDEADCWLWTGYVGDNGYGTAAISGHRRRYAHRLVYTLLVGPIPEGLVLDHRCKVRHCVNPAHLEAVTVQENARRVRSGGHPNKNGLCRRGLHPWAPSNMYIPADGRERCLECHRERQRKHRAAGKGRQGRPGLGQGSLL